MVVKSLEGLFNWRVLWEEIDMTGDHKSSHLKFISYASETPEQVRQFCESLSCPHAGFHKDLKNRSDRVVPTVPLRQPQTEPVPQALIPVPQPLPQVPQALPPPPQEEQANTDAS